MVLRLFCISDVVQCLRLSRLDIISKVPVKEGSKMILSCRYNLSRGDYFEGIEWFKDELLFYIHIFGNDDAMFNDRTVSSTDQFEVDVRKTYSLSNFNERIAVKNISRYSNFNL